MRINLFELFDVTVYWNDLTYIERILWLYSADIIAILSSYCTYIQLILRLYWAHIVLIFSWYYGYIELVLRWYCGNIELKNWADIVGIELILSLLAILILSWYFDYNIQLILLLYWPGKSSYWTYNAGLNGCNKCCIFIAGLLLQFKW